MIPQFNKEALELGRAAQAHLSAARDIEQRASRLRSTGNVLLAKAQALQDAHEEDWKAHLLATSKDQSRSSITDLFLAALPKTLTVEQLAQIKQAL